MATDKIKVLYIGGFGRSGSTLIEMMLGKIPALFPAGELRWIWNRSLIENQLCGDGTAFREHPFWTQVMQQAFGGLDTIDTKRVAFLREHLERLRYIPMLRNPASQTPEFKAYFAEFADYLTKLYAAIKNISGCEVIVDSSKHPPYGYLVNAIPDFEVYVLHLVRDSRAVAYSWQRKKLRPEIHWQEQYMRTYSLPECSKNWTVNNITTGRIKSINPHYLFMRYEDFTQDPVGNFQKILDFVGQGSTPIDFMNGMAFEPPTSLSISGNPIRFEKKDVVVRSDAEWRKQMPLPQQALVTFLTFPLLLWYGYLFR